MSNGLRSALVAAPGDPAVELWARAAASAGLQAPRRVSWPDVLSGAAAFTEGEAVLAERLDPVLPTRVGGSRDRHDRQAAALQTLQESIKRAGAVPTTSVEQTVVALDRARRDTLLAASGIPVLAQKGTDLAGLLPTAKGEMFFLRPRYAAPTDSITTIGAGAENWWVDTYLALTRRPEGVELHSSLRERRYNGQEARRLLEILAVDDIHVVSWLHRVHLGSWFYDFRFAVLDGRVTHAAGRIMDQAVAREYYGGRSRGLDALDARYGPARRQKLIDLAERAAACFPEVRSLGVDIALDNFESEYVVEVDPFGAHLPGAVGLPGGGCEGLDVRAALLRSLAERRPD